jgi:hypothetical protein
MSSKIVTVRLTWDEYAMLRKMSSKGTGMGCNPSELFRTWLWREWNKTAIGSSKAPQSVYSEMRIGRPRKQKEPSTMMEQFRLAEGKP